MPQDYKIGNTWPNQGLIWIATVPPPMASTRDGVLTRTAIFTQGNSNKQLFWSPALQWIPTLSPEKYPHLLPTRMQNSSVSQFIHWYFSFSLQPIVSNWCHRTGEHPWCDNYMQLALAREGSAHSAPECRAHCL